jgi:hypothetical protein
MSDLDRRKRRLLKKLSAFLFGPWAFTFTTFSIIIGVLGDNFVGKYNNLPDAYLISVYIVGGAYLIVIIITLIVALNIFSKYRNKEISTLIANQPQTCKEIQNNLNSIQSTAEHFKSVLVGNIVEKSVMIGSKVDNLEGSVEKDKRIIILTSKFILEGNTDFSNVIIQNFRKGVKYQYLVPDYTDKPYLGNLDKYWEAVKDWYGQFSCFLNNLQVAENLKDEATKNGNITEWHPRYIRLLDSCISAHKKMNSQKEKAMKEIREKTIKAFSEQMVQYKLDPSLFFVTVAMYQQDRQQKWRAIIKLPTENPEENFVAFSLDHASEIERDNFYRSIESLISEEKKIQIDESVFEEEDID